MKKNSKTKKAEKGKKYQRQINQEDDEEDKRSPNYDDQLERDQDRDFEYDVPDNVAEDGGDDDNYYDDDDEEADTQLHSDDRNTTMVSEDVELQEIPKNKKGLGKKGVIKTKKSGKKKKKKSAGSLMVQYDNLVSKIDNDFLWFSLANYLTIVACVFMTILVICLKKKEFTLGGKSLPVEYVYGALGFPFVLSLLSILSHTYKVGFLLTVCKFGWGLNLVITVLCLNYVGAVIGLYQFYCTFGLGKVLQEADELKEELNARGINADGTAIEDN